MPFHLAPLAVTFRDQLEVMHISEGCYLETLADTTRLTTNDGEKLMNGLSFGAVAFDLE